jgi:hypothetical protein
LADEMRTLSFVAVCGGEERKVREWAAEFTDVVSVLPDPTHRVSASHGIALTPFIVAVDRTGVVQARGLVNDRGGLQFYADAVRADDAVRGDSIRWKEAAGDEIARLGSY